MLRLKFISHERLSGMKSQERVSAILDNIRDNNLVLIEGRLRSTEEAALIRDTMSIIGDNIDTFNGLEISVLHNDRSNKGMWRKIREKMIDLLSGHRHGLTIIGPASMIKELNKESDDVEIRFQKIFIEDMLKNSKKVIDDAS
jgi:hypothetical protein